MKKSFFATIILVSTLAASCSRMSEVVDTANTSITTYLHGPKIYDPNNYPDPVPADIRGYYQNIDGVFRYIVTQDTEGRDNWEEVTWGSVVSVSFDARVFSGSSFDRFPLFYSNIASTINYYASGNPQFDPVEWPATPYIASIGGGQLMPAIENALLSCRVGDRVQLFIPPDKAYGGKQNYAVPAYSTLAFEITIDGLQKPADPVTEYLNSLGIYDSAFAPADAEGLYNRIGNSYRYILNENRDGRPSTDAAIGDTIYYWFDARRFETSVANSPYFHSNIEATKQIIAAEYPEYQPEIDQWPSEPRGVILGAGSNKILDENDKDTGRTILNALGNTLPSCREGDKVWVFLLPDALGNEETGGITPPAGSSLMYELEITEIKK